MQFRLPMRAPPGGPVDQAGPPGHPFRRRITQPAWVAWIALALCGPVHALPVIGSATVTLGADRVIASTGDPITARLQINQSGLLLVGTIDYVYSIASTARYVPNSITLNGAAIADTDLRVKVFADSLRLSISALGIGATTLVDLQVRAVGSIGQPVHHLGVVRGLLTARQVAHGAPTWIEDENAVAIVPALQMDTYLHRTNGGNQNNYGGAALVNFDTSDNRRGLLQFNLGLTPVPVGYDVVAAYLELWPAAASGAPITINVNRLRQTWTEGTQDDARCVGGATWDTRDCTNNWTVQGGYYDATLAGSTIVDASTSFAAINLRQLAADWIAGTRTNQGVLLRATSATSGRSVTFATREAQSGSNRAARLVIVLAPPNTYTAPAVVSATAEIVPNDVLTNVPNQRFVYTVRGGFDAATTGMNRVTITVPAGFTPTRVDSLRAAGLPLTANTDARLTSGEYEVWGLGNVIDVRWSPPVGLGSIDPRLDLVFRAGTPLVANSSGDDFASIIDHDRRGYTTQAASKGNANGVPGDGNTWTVRTTTGTITSIAVTPADTTVASGHSVPYRAVATYNTGDTADISEFATWAVTPPALGTFAGKPGVLTTDSTGTGQVNATFASRTSAAARLQVDPPALVHVRVLPASASFPAGVTQAYDAYGIYENGDSVAVTASATWASYDPTVAHVTGPGQIQGVRNGTAKITATLSGIESPPATANVTPAELVSIHVSPTDTTVALGFSVQMQAQGTYTDASTLDLTSVVTWTPAPPGVVDLDADGFARSLAEGSAAITATLGGVTSNTATLTVNPPELLFITLTPPVSTIALGDGVQLHAAGTYSSGPLLDVTGTVTWNTVPGGIVTVATDGFASSAAVGTASVSATLGGVTSNNISISVTPPVVGVVDSVRVSPAPIALPPATDYGLTATAFFNDGTHADRTAQSTWATTDSTVAIVDSTGVLHTGSPGVALVQATFSGVTSLPCTVRVGDTAMDSLHIAPADTVVVLGATLPYRAFAHADASVYDVTNLAVWSTADTLVATAEAGGLVTTHGVGLTTVGASVGGVQALAARLQVNPATPTLVSVLPASTTLRLGRTKQMTSRATFSDGSTADVTALSTWASDAPGLLYVDGNGVATAIALGTVNVTATYAGLTSAAATVTVLPAVQVEALAAGDQSVTPGTPAALLLTLRLTNRYLDVRRLTALRAQVSGPLTALHLWRDDGDGGFDPPQDTELAMGAPSAGTWTATGLSVDLAVGTSQTLFVTGDVSMTAAAHGSTADAGVAAVGDIFWAAATALVADFPLQSAGAVHVHDFVQAQVVFQPVAAGTIVAGTTDHSVFELRLPDDGGSADSLTAFGVRQLGTARAGLEIEHLKLQSGPSPWTDVADLVHTGGGRWAASDLHLPVPVAGLWVRVIADAALGSEAGRTIQFELPLSSLDFASGRTGPVDAAWDNPNVLTLESPHTLFVSRAPITAPGIVPRASTDLAVLGLELTAVAAAPDTLRLLRLRNLASGPGGALANPNAELVRAALWSDADGNGVRSDTDPLLEAIVPLPGDSLVFGATGLLHVVLDAQPHRFLVTLTPDSLDIRDGEQLAVRVANATDVVTSGALSVQVSGALQTLDPPVIDGQSAAGYGVRPITNRILAPGSGETIALDFELPANGLEDDVLTGLQIENNGTVTASDVGVVALRHEDGDGVLGAGDALVTPLVSQGDRTWVSPTLSLPLRAGLPQRFIVTVRPATGATTGRTFEARVPAGGVTVTSGNDGPVDHELRGGGPLVFASPNQVIWVAGVVGDHTVDPDGRDRTILNLEVLNTYSQARTLVALDVATRGTAGDLEYDVWRLYADTNQNGIVDASEAPLATATANAGSVHFGSFAFDVLPLVQARLLVVYSLADGNARDASTADAAIVDANSFTYAVSGQGTTSTAAEFEINSPGLDTIDGVLARAIESRAIVPQTLGGGETNVVTLDLRVPSNGLDSDVLEALTVEFVASPTGAEFGPDIAAIRLWQESDLDPAAAHFDAATDILLRTLTPGGGALRFGGLAAPIATGGHRFYVTVDAAPAPGDGRTMQLQVPLGGLQVASANDGPIDSPVVGSTVHHMSASALLATTFVQPLRASRGQSLTVHIMARNRGSVALDSIAPLRFEAAPALPFQIESGPVPARVQLAPGVSDTLAYRIHFDAAGSTQLIAVVGRPDSSVESAPASSAGIEVQEPPTGLGVTMLSSLPALLSRGQSGIVACTWKLLHPDHGAQAAPIVVQRLAFVVEDQSGVAERASAVLSAFDIRSGNTVYAASTSPPDTSWVQVDLSTPIVLAPDEERSVTLQVAIAATATATSFRLRVVDATGVSAIDANSAAPVTIQASLPWTSQAAALRTPTPHVDAAIVALLPPRLDRGQTNIVAGRITFTVPGQPGESEVRLTQIALDVRDAAGAPLDPSTALGRLEIRSNSTILLSTSTFDTSSGRLQLPLTIPKTIASGAPEPVDVVVDILANATASSLRLELAAATDVVTRDAVSGVLVPVEPVPADPMPRTLGLATLETAAVDAIAGIVSRTPASSFPGAASVAVADVVIRDVDPVGSAAIELTQLVVRTLDDAGNGLVPRGVLRALRVRQAGVIVASAPAIPDAGAAISIPWTSPVAIAPGDSVALTLEADLVSPLEHAWVRFAFDADALRLRDANDPSRPLLPAGSLPFASDLIRIVTAPTQVALGVTTGPPANVTRGASGAALLGLQIAHPGNANQAALALSTLVVRVQDANAKPLAATSFASAARLVAAGTVVAATLAGDSLQFDLAALAPLAPAAALDFALELDIRAAPATDDVRLVIGNSALVATSGGNTLTAVGLDGRTLLYTSPTVHVLAPTVEASFSNYPNPFVAGRESTHIAFYLPADARVTAEIYTLTGDRVVRLIDGRALPAGLFDTLLWDGRNGAGQFVRNGTYLLRLQIDGPQGGRYLRKLAVLR